MVNIRIQSIWSLLGRLYCNPSSRMSILTVTRTLCWFHVAMSLTESLHSLDTHRELRSEATPIQGPVSTWRYGHVPATTRSQNLIILLILSLARHSTVQLFKATKTYRFLLKALVTEDSNLGIRLKIYWGTWLYIWSFDSVSVYTFPYKSWLNNSTAIRHIASHSECCTL